MDDYDMNAMLKVAQRSAEHDARVEAVRRVLRPRRRPPAVRTSIYRALGYGLIGAYFALKRARRWQSSPEGKAWWDRYIPTRIRPHYSRDGATWRAA